MAGEHDNNGVGVDPFCLFEYIDAVDLRKVNIQDQDASLKEATMKQFDCLLAVPGGMDGVGDSRFSKGDLDHFDIGGAVIDDKYRNQLFVHVHRHSPQKCSGYEVLCLKTQEKNRRKPL